VHAPPQAPKDAIEHYRGKFPDISEKRAVLMAMLKHLDDGVGAVVGKLKKEGLFDNTIVFFLTDNGGSRAMSADNTPLRGFKGSLSEGGIRTPFIVSWPAKFAGGRTVDTPVISLDILPTALDAVGATGKNAAAFDGKSLLPLLTGQATNHHETLYWSEGGASGEWALRRGKWKLHAVKKQLQLFNLADDPGEKVDLTGKHPEQSKTLRAAYEAWIEQMADPISGSGKRWQDEPAEQLTDRQKKRLEKRLEKRRERKKKQGARRKEKEARPQDSPDKEPRAKTRDPGQ